MQKLFIIIATFVLGTTAHAGDFYGAIAFSSATGISGTSYNWATRGQAEYQALKACNQNDCQVVAWVKNGCSSVSWASKYVRLGLEYFFGSRPNEFFSRM